MDTNDKIHGLIEGYHAYLLKKCEQEVIEEDKRKEKRERLTLKDRKLRVAYIIRKNKIAKAKKLYENDNEKLHKEICAIEKKYKEIVEKIKESKDAVIKIYQRADDAEKYRLHKEYREKCEDELLNCNNSLSRKDLNLPAKFATRKELVDAVNKSEFIFAYFNFPAQGIDQFFSCIFIQGNMAWISMAEDGTYRYFTKAIESENNIMRTCGYSSWDLLEIVHGFDIDEACKFVAELLNINFKSDKWVMKQKSKYRNNLEVIGDASVTIKQKFPILYKFIKNHLYILEQMNVWGKTHLVSVENNKEQTVFFISLRYLSRLLEKDYSVIGRIINAFSVLGLIKRINIETTAIPENIIAGTKKNRVSAELKAQNERKEALMKKEFFGNVHCPDIFEINYYAIPIYDDKLFKNAEAKVIRLKKKGITNVSLVSRKAAVAVFGEEYANKVFINFKEENEEDGDEIESGDEDIENSHNDVRNDFFDFEELE